MQYNGSDSYRTIPPDINRSYPLLNYIPYNVTETGKIVLDTCHVYTTPGDPNSTLSECTDFVYSEEYFTRTITTDVSPI